MLRGDPLTSWVLTDGKAGDELQALAVAERLSLSPKIRHVAPRQPFAWLMPWGPIDPREGPRAAVSPVAPPYPDLLIGSGRRAVPYLRHVKRASAGRTFTVFLKDPRTGARSADFIWVPEHDRLGGPNVVRTLTPPHRHSPERLAAARAHPDTRLASLPRPLVSVLIGGPSRHHAFSGADVERLVADLSKVAASGAGLAITTSRRTPTALTERMNRLVERPGVFLWDGSGENPYTAMLAQSDFIIVTADSTNMVGEAAASGRPVLVFEPRGGHAKFSTMLHGLREKGIVHRFDGRLVGLPYPPLDSTDEIAQAIAERLASHRRAFGTTGAVLPPETT